MVASAGPAAHDHEAWVGAVARALMGTAPMGVLVLDEHLRTVAVNARIEAMGGLGADQLVGRRPTEVFGQSLAGAEALYRQVLTSRQPVAGSRFSAVLPSDEDALRHWDLTCLPLPDGGPVGLLVLVDEVTQEVHDAERQELVMESLRIQTRHDPLTGLPNRLGLHEWWDAHAGDGTPVEVVYADLDGFKAVNDVAGHLVGDEVLTRIARSMAAVAYPDEIVARVGGDEFVGIAPADGNDLAARMSRAVDDVAESDLRATAVSVTCGVGFLMPTEALAVGIGRADTAMYRAKAARG